MFRFRGRCSSAAFNMKTGWNLKPSDGLCLCNIFVRSLSHEQVVFSGERSVRSEKKTESQETFAAAAPPAAETGHSRWRHKSLRSGSLFCLI